MFLFSPRNEESVMQYCIRLQSDLKQFSGCRSQLLSTLQSKASDPLTLALTFGAGMGSGLATGHVRGKSDKDADTSSSRRRSGHHPIIAALTLLLKVGL